MVNSESLARGGVMTMTPCDDLNFVFLLSAFLYLCVSGHVDPCCPVWAVMTVSLINDNPLVF